MRKSGGMAIAGQLSSWPFSECRPPDRRCGIQSETAKLRRAGARLPRTISRAVRIRAVLGRCSLVIRLAPTLVVGYISWRRNAHEDGVIPAARFALCSVAGFPYARHSADRGWEAKLGGSGAQNARWQT